MQASWKEAGRAMFSPLVAGLVRVGIGAHAISGVGLGFALAAGYAAGLGRLRLAGISLMLSALCDLLDGPVARRTSRTGPVGAFLDSCTDRVAEGAIYLGLIIHFRDLPVMVLVTGVALIGSYMVSYARARAEGLGISCQVGLLERPERLIVLIAALVSGGVVLEVGLALVALFSVLTFIQRFRHVVHAAAGTRPSGDHRTGS
jgi:CDP-diacylglycerol--glycerol-3-phosphate 3-phosphatidyltransferase